MNKERRKKIAEALELISQATIGFVTVPLGLYMIFSKEMLIVNDFYWQKKERATQYIE